MVSLNIGHLLGKQQGGRMRFDFDEPLTFEIAHQCELTENVRGQVECLKLPQEINVQVKNIETRAKGVCVRCMKECSVPIQIDCVEREFLIDLPEEDLGSGEEVFYVDSSRNAIVLDELLRQEILLHFPARTLCFDGCKGLCDKCGTNLNEKQCTCTHEDNSRIRPFRIPL